MQSLSVVDKELWKILLVKKVEQRYLLNSLTKSMLFVNLLRTYNEDQKAQMEKIIINIKIVRNKNMEKLLFKCLKIIFSTWLVLDTVTRPLGKTDHLSGITSHLVKMAILDLGCTSILETGPII